jgi:hypothetical protein
MNPGESRRAGISPAMSRDRQQVTAIHVGLIPARRDSP